MYKNDLLDVDLSAHLYIDGERIHKCRLNPGGQRRVLGIRKTASSVLPFKFQELELVGAFPRNIPWVACCLFLICH